MLYKAKCTISRLGKQTTTTPKWQNLTKKRSGVCIFRYERTYDTYAYTSIRTVPPLIFYVRVSKFEPP